MTLLRRKTSINGSGIRGIILLLVISLQNQGVEATTPATLLFDQLFATYNSGVRPYCNSNSATPVRLDLALRQIVDLHEPTQILTLNLWVRLAWTDCQLTWTPSSHGNLTSLVVPFKYVWVPDLTLYDSTTEDFPGYDDFRVAIYSDGSVYYNFPTIIQSRCIVNVEKFPYDSQTCSLTFGSWSYHGLEMDLVYKNPYGDLSSSVDNVEWNISSFTAQRHVLYYGCCPEPYPDVTYYLHIKRKPDFYVVNIILPTFLITSMAILGFFLPSESGEKVSLQITVMLALAVFQLLVADSLPPSSDTTPLIGDIMTGATRGAGEAHSSRTPDLTFGFCEAIYFNFCLFLVGFACVMAVLVLTFHYYPALVMHRHVVKIFLRILPRFTFVYVPPIPADRPKKDLNYSKESDTVRPNTAKGKVNKIDVIPADNNNVITGSGEEEEAQKVVKYIRVTSVHWIALSKVVDRLACVVFLLVGIIGTSIVFTQFRED